MNLWILNAFGLVGNGRGRFAIPFEDMSIFELLMERTGMKRWLAEFEIRNFHDLLKFSESLRTRRSKLVTCNRWHSH